MKKYSLILLAAAAFVATGCSDDKPKKSSYTHDYEQIWLPTPAPKAASKQEFAKDQRFVLDEKADIMQNGKKIGEIYEGSPVKLLSEQSGIATVELSGKVVDNTLAFSEGGEFVYAKFDTAPSEKMSVQIASKSLTASHADAFDAVETFYYDSCTSCHAAHHPSEHAKDEWDAYISAMQMNAKISDEQKERILRFMQAHASDGQFKAE